MNVKTAHYTVYTEATNKILECPIHVRGKRGSGEKDLEKNRAREPDTVRGESERKQWDTVEKWPAVKMAPRLVLTWQRCHVQLTARGHLTRG